MTINIHLFPFRKYIIKVLNGYVIIVINTTEIMVINELVNGTK